MDDRLNQLLMEQLDALRRQFLHELPTRLGAIEELAQSIISSNDDSSEQQVEQLCAACHKLVGISGTHRLNNLADTARSIELLLCAALEQTGRANISVIDRSALAQLVNSLRQEASSLN